jgi:hypothetical protein
MKRRLLELFLLCFAVWTVPNGQLFAQTKESAAFDKLRGLAGNWEGTFAWSGGRNATGKMGAQYYTTGNGSAVVENLTQDGVPSMTSVYYLDGADLRLTHFCADKGEITFSFVDITNLRSPTSGHVDGLEIRFIAPDHVTLRFHFKSGETDSQELVELQRKV